MTSMLRGYLLAFLLSLGVTVSNSFARFAYALVLPAMRAELGWNYAQAGWLNTANAIGYLTGAILTRLVIRHTGNRRLFIGGVLLTALALLATGLTRNLFWLGFWRMMSGVTGAAAFISGGALSANMGAGRPFVASTTAIYFAGGGVGFILCGVAIPLLLEASGPSAWPQAWIWMGVAGLLMFSLCAWAATQIDEPNIEPPGTSNSGVAASQGVKQLGAGLLAYALFGLGYIAYMTFVIAWMRDHGAGTGQVIAVWCAFGAASLLGPWLWRWPLQTWLPARMLAATIAMLALGTLLPLLHAGSASLFASAVLFGSSMWNIPGSVTNLAKRALPKHAWGSAVATFTIVFSMGQIIGPVATGWLADLFGSLRAGLAPAVGVLAAGAIIALMQRDVVHENGKHARK
jgi:predicted MFS family arabinose efflux permease